MGKLLDSEPSSRFSGSVRWASFVLTALTVFVGVVVYSVSTSHRCATNREALKYIMEQGTELSRANHEQIETLKVKLDQLKEGQMEIKALIREH